MSKYLVLYTIKNDENKSKTDKFESGLKSLRLEKFEDQSTYYGSYDGNYEGLKRKLEKLKDDILTKDDKVTLFYATNWPNNNYTIEKIEIK
jgi:hypothetical protein